MSETMPVDGVVILTEKAAHQVKTLQTADPENGGKALRVYVEGGGCSGLRYGLVFDEKRDADIQLEYHGATVVVDPESATYLRGAVVDYADSLTDGGFKISNPNARHSCGCGKSFEA